MHAGEAVEMVGMSMTYTLFEWAKENLDALLEAQPESLVVEAMERIQVPFNWNPYNKGAWGDTLYTVSNLPRNQGMGQTPF